MAGKSKAPGYGNSAQARIIELFRELLHISLADSVPAWLDLQLTLPQLRTEFVIAHNKRSSVARIAGQIGVGEPTASYLVDKLVQAGLAHRGEDPEDRRRAIVSLSPAGEKMIEKLLGWEDFLKEKLAQISAEDLSSLSRGLTAITNKRSPGVPVKAAR